MICSVHTMGVNGILGNHITVECYISNGLPGFDIVGLPDAAVKEARERVRAAAKTSGMHFPASRITVNLAPANLKKSGTHYDLPILLSIMSASGSVRRPKSKSTFIGELSLDGRLKAVRGVLPIIAKAREKGYTCCVLPIENQAEGELIPGMQIVGASSLQEVCAYLKGECKKHRSMAKEEVWECNPEYEDFSDIHGQQFVKRAVEIAVAGGHNLLMVGPPGVGKTAIAKRIPSILPPLEREESIELTMICSIVGELDKMHPLKSVRPFREVHASVTGAGLLGGGVYPKPGEISLAHKGVLFLDEIAEFPRGILESLRKPLEEQEIKIIREKGEYIFPAEFLLVAAMNPCPCGNYPDLNKCTCTTAQRRAYLGKLSQPFLERVDLCVEVPKIQYSELAEETKEETSASIRERIVRARETQKERFKNIDIQTNARMRVSEIEQYCVLTSQEQQLMRTAYEQLEMSARTYHKVLAISRTIADLEGEEHIQNRHLQEALGYRMFDEGHKR